MLSVFIYIFIMLLSFRESMGDKNMTDYMTVEECLKSDYPALEKVDTSLANFISSSLTPWLPKTFPRCWFVVKQVLCSLLIKNSNQTRRSNVDSNVKSNANSNIISNVKSNGNICSMLKRECTMLNEAALLDKELCEMPYYQIPNVTINSFEYCSKYFQQTRNKKSWLIRLEKSSNHGPTYQDEIGCSLPCESDLKLYKHNQLSVYLPILIQSLLTCVAVLFTMMTFIIDWKNQRKYPAVILFILTSLYFTCICGWLLQFLGVAGKISCNEKNNSRYSEPNGIESYVCIISFVLIYSSMVAITSWYLILMYSWNSSFKGLGLTKDTVREKIKFLHLAGWTPSFVFTLIILFMEEVESHDITAICFTGYSSLNIRIIFVATPIFFSLTFGSMLLISAVRHLYKLKSSSKGKVVQKAMQNLTHTIYRLCAYGVIMFVTSVLPTILLLIDDFSQVERSTVYLPYYICKIKELHNLTKTCDAPRNHELVYLHIQFSCLCISAVATSSWTWTKATIKIWIKFFRRKCCRREKNEKDQHAQWFMRINKKKVRPFIPPINPEDPLKSSFPGYIPQRTLRRENFQNRRGSLHDFMDDFNLKLRRKSSLNVRRRRSSDDIRSVMELFSARRGTNISIESIYSVGSMFQVPKKQNRSKSLNSLQSFGHLTAGNARKLSEGSRCNFVVRPMNMSNTEVDFYDRVYTPISRAHKSNIVADCIPYDIDVAASPNRLAKTAP